MASYIAIIHKDPDSEYGVSFPDFPGCISAGSDIDEALDMGREALTWHIQTMREDGDPIPAPSSLGAAQSHEFAEGAVLFAAIEVSDVPVRPKRVNITLPENDLAKIDAYAAEHGYTRSGLLLQGAKRMMRENA
jgi:predicted RNase H-like HicB family nuclease